MEDYDSTQRFSDAARRYCEFIEMAATMPVGTRIQHARRHLADLVRAACDLPPGDAKGPDTDDNPPAPANWPGFGDVDVYWEVFDPYEDEPRVAGSLSDDLLDIYVDLRRGLGLYDAGHAGAAAWEWRLHFDQHWGHHAVDALRALHRACGRVGVGGA